MKKWSDLTCHLLPLYTRCAGCGCTYISFLIQIQSTLLEWISQQSSFLSFDSQQRAVTACLLDHVKPNVLQKYTYCILTSKRWSVQGKKEPKTYTVLTPGSQHPPLHSTDLCWASLLTNTDRAYQGMVVGPKYKMYNPTYFYTAKLCNKRFISSWLTTGKGPWLMLGLSLQTILLFFPGSMHVLTHLICAMEHDKSDMIGPWLS